MRRLPRETHDIVGAYSSQVVYRCPTERGRHHATLNPTLCPSNSGSGCFGETYNRMRVRAQTGIPFSKVLARKAHRSLRTRRKVLASRYQQVNFFGNSEDPLLRKLEQNKRWVLKRLLEAVYSRLGSALAGW